MYEAKSLINYGYYKSMEDWEQTRLLAYITAQVNSTKKLKLNDIMKFHWDENENEKGKNGKIDEVSLQRLKNKAKSILENNILQ